MHCSYRQVFFCFSWFFSSKVIVSMKPFGENKNFELFLFLLFDHCRSRFLEDGPEKNNLSNEDFF